MSIYTLRQKKNIVLTCCIGLGLFIAIAINEIFTALLGSIVLYTLFKPFYLHLTKTRNWNNSVSSILVIICSFLLIILPSLFFSWMVIGKISEYAHNPEVFYHLIERIENFSGLNINRPEFFSSTLNNAQAWIIGTFSNIVNGVFSIFLKIAVMYFVLFYMFIHSERMEEAVFRYMPFREQNCLLFSTELKNITYASVVGQGLISIIQGSLVGIGFLIFGLEDPFFWGVVCVFLSFLPVVGAPLVFVPAGIIALSDGNTFGGAGILLWGFILVINIDNVLRLLISKRLGDIHPLITIIGVIIGVPYFGILGLVFGPLLLSYFILLLKIYEIRYIKNQSIPIHDVSKQ